MSNIRRAFGTLTPTIFFVAHRPDAEGLHHILLAPYSDYPTPAGYSREEAGTLAEVDRLQTRLREQEMRKFRREGLREDQFLAEMHKRVDAKLHARLVSADTSEYEKEFIMAYLKLAAEKRDKYQRRFEEYSMYLWARENDLGKRDAAAEVWTGQMK